MSLFQTVREDLQVESQQKRKHDEISDKCLKGQSLLLTMSSDFHHLFDLLLLNSLIKPQIPQFPEIIGLIISRHQ